MARRDVIDIVELTKKMIWEDLKAIEALNEPRKQRLLDATTANRLSVYLQKLTPLLREEREQAEAKEQDTKRLSLSDLIAEAQRLQEGSAHSGKR